MTIYARTVICLDTDSYYKKIYANDVLHEKDFDDE